MSYSPGGGGGSLSTDNDVTMNNPGDGQVLTYDATLGKWKNATGGTSAVSSVAGKTGVVTLVASDVSGVLAASNNLSDVSTPATARTNLGLGTAATQSSSAFDAAGAATTAQAASLQKLSNLSDLASAATARTNLGLGTAATVSSTAGGDLSGTLPSPTVAKVNGVAVTGTPSSGQVLTATGAAAASWSTPATAPVTSVAGKTGVVTLAAADVSGVLTASNNLSDVPTPATARTNLGLGTAATISSTAGGDLSGTLPSPTVAKVNGVAVTGTPSSGQVLTATSGTAASWATANFAIPDNVPGIIIEVSGTYPLRNTVTSSATRPIIWRGPDAPTIGSGYAINDMDTWEPTA